MHQLGYNGFAPKKEPIIIQFLTKSGEGRKTLSVFNTSRFVNKSLNEACNAIIVTIILKSLLLGRLLFNTHLFLLTFFLYTNL